MIGADTNSRVMNPADKKTYPLFGDGAGAVLVTKGSAEQGLLSYTLGADGSGEQLLIRPAGGSRVPLDAGRRRATRLVREDGRPARVQVGRAAAGGFVAAGARRGRLHKRPTSSCGCCIRPTSAFSTRPPTPCAIDRSKVETHLDRYGNTSAGSVPIALDEALRAGRFGRGDLLLMCGFGGGLSWGTALMRW